MEKNLIFSGLLGVYRGILTEKQAEALEYYYDNDMSLAEISEITGISRQGVRAFIKNGEKSLLEMEEILHLHERLMHLDSVKNAAREILTSPDKRVTALAQKILSEAKLIEGE